MTPPSVVAQSVATACCAANFTWVASFGIDFITTDPTDGWRIRRMNADADLVEFDMPELAIADPAVWQTVRAHLKAMRDSLVKAGLLAPSPRPLTGPSPWRGRRAQHALRA